jgi:hypothetical protein
MWDEFANGRAKMTLHIDWKLITCYVYTRCGPLFMPTRSFSPVDITSYWSQLLNTSSVNCWIFSWLLCLLRSFISHLCKDSASSRISKGQGYQGFLRKRAGSSFGQKRATCIVQGKTWKIDRISLLLGSIKCFPISFIFNTFKTL